MTTYSAKEIAASPRAVQRRIVACGEIWESDSGEGWLVWEPMKRGQAVRDKLWRGVLQALAPGPQAGTAKGTAKAG